MRFFQNLSRFPQGTRLSLFARLSASRPELWCHVGYLTPTGGIPRIDWARGAEIVAPVWSSAVADGGQRSSELGVIEFGVTLQGGAPEPIAVGLVTADIVRQSRGPWTRPSGGSLSGDLGGPRPYRSSWPAPHQLSGHGRRR